MKRIIISTESVADLPQAFIQQHQIQVIPMHVIMDGKGYLENEIAVNEIFEFYQQTKKIPTTTSKNAQEYKCFFKNIKEEFPNSIIVHIGYTSKSSGSFYSAMAAAKGLEDLYLIDTLNVTGGLATIIMYAVQLLEKNPAIHYEQFIKQIEEIIPKTKLTFVPCTLEFLKASGRVGKAAFISGSLLKIKPCIEIKEGILIATKKYRGEMSTVANKLMQDFFKQYNFDRKLLNLVYSVGLEENIKRAAEKLAKETGFQQINWIEAGPTISTHAGPGCFGISAIEM